MLSTYDMSANLRGEYKEAFEKASLYGVLDRIEIDSYDDRMMNLYDSMLEAQKSDDPVEKVVGSDIEQFCKEYFGEYDRISKWKQFLSFLCRTCILLGIFAFIDIYGYTQGSRQEYDNMLAVKTDISALVACMIFYLIIIKALEELSKRLLFKVKVSTFAYTVIHELVFWVCLFGAVLLIPEFNVMVSSVAMAVLAGAYALTYLIVNAVNNYKKYGRLTRISKEEKLEKKEFNKEISEKNTLEGTLKGMTWRFKRLNKKAVRKGKEGYSQEEFAGKVRKEAEWSKYFDILITVLFLISWVGGMIDDFRDSTNMIILDIIWNAVWGFIYYKLCKFFIDASNEGIKEQLYVIDECEKKGINVVEYAELLRNEESDEFEQAEETIE